MRNKEDDVIYRKKYRELNKEKLHEREKKYQQNNKKQIAINQKKYAEANKDKIAEQRKQYHQDNKEEITEQQKRYREANKEKEIERHKKYREANKEKATEYYRQYRKNNTDKVNIKTQKRRARKKMLINDLTLNQWESIKIAFDNCCCYCGEIKPLTQEHFIPLSKDGEYTVNNILPSCQSCNSSKGNKDFNEWFPKYKYYSEERNTKILEHVKELII